MGNGNSASEAQDNELLGHILTALTWGLLIGSAVLVGMPVHVASLIPMVSYLLGMFVHGLMVMTEERSFEILQKRGRYRIQRRLSLLADHYECLEDINTTVMFLLSVLSIHAFLLISVVGLSPLGVSKALAVVLAVFLIGVAGLTRMMKYGLNLESSTPD